MEGQPIAFRPRGIASLLDETFSLYFRRIGFWVSMVSVVQIPIGMISLVLAQVWGGGGATAIVGLLGLLGSVYVYGAAMHGVGQHYVTGETVIRECYARAWSRVRSLTALAALGLLVITALLWLVTLGDIVWIGVLLALLLAPILAVAVYWSLAPQAAVVEGQQALASLGRSLALIRGSWWRVLGLALMLMLVAFGLGMVVASPFALASMAASVDPTSRTASLLLDLGRVGVVIIVTPVLFIAWTLLYYDIRVRKEKYDVAALSRDLGMVAT